MVVVSIACVALAVSNVNSTDKFSWGENIGWMNWRDSGSPSGDQGVNIGPTFMSGFIWCENVGYVNVGNGGGPYTNTDHTNFGVNVATNGDLSGFAWGENIGWINFSGGAMANPPQPARVDTGTNPPRLRGYVWGENIGWINLDVAEAGKFVAFTPSGCAGDADNDGDTDSTDLNIVLTDFGCLP